VIWASTFEKGEGKSKCTVRIR